MVLRTSCALFFVIKLHIDHAYVLATTPNAQITCIMTPCTGDHKGPHPSSTPPPPLLYCAAGSARNIVGAGVEEMRSGGPGGRPSCFITAQPFLLFVHYCVVVPSDRTLSF